MIYLEHYLLYTHDIYTYVISHFSVSSSSETTSNNRPNSLKSLGVILDCLRNTPANPILSGALFWTLVLVSSDVLSDECLLEIENWRPPSRMIYPMPNPSCTTGPKPKSRRLGFPQFDVDRMVWFNFLYAKEEKNAGVGMPFFSAIFIKANKWRAIPFPDAANLIPSEWCSVDTLNAASFSSFVASGLSQRLQNINALSVARRTASVRPW